MEDKKLIRVATYTSVTVATIFIGIKFYAWWMTDSSSLLASLLDSVLDALASILILFAVRQSQQPATRDYRFGYGKIEALAALAQSVLILASVLWIFYEAFTRLTHPDVLPTIEPGLWVMVVTILGTLALVAFQNYVVQRTGSVAIRADSMHYRMDFLLNSGVFLSLCLTHFTHVYWIDPLVAVILAFYIMIPLRQITREAFGVLMDREIEETMRRDIEAIALAHPAVYGVHDLRTRESGDRQFIQMHLELDGEITLSQAHKVAEEVEKRILEKYSKCEIIIHQDPVGVVEKRDQFLG